MNELSKKKRILISISNVGKLKRIIKFCYRVIFQCNCCNRNKSLLQFLVKNVIYMQITDLGTKKQTFMTWKVSWNQILQFFFLFVTLDPHQLFVKIICFKNTEL